MTGKLAAVVVALGALGACDDNQAGDLAASRFGDLSHPLGERAGALAELTATCGLRAPPPEAEGLLRRRPYLQRLTDRSVQVVWTADPRLPGAALVVTRPDGTLVATQPAVRDASARPIAGAVQWSAAATDLAPDTTYCYELQAGGARLRHGGFRTAPAAASGRPVRFVAFGDSGDGGPDQQAVLDQIRTVPFDLVLHTGDIAYASGTRAELESFFFRMYADLLEGFPVFPASGNHEYETEDAAPFREAFVLPDNGGPEGRERWYSYDWGDVHFVVLDTERVGPRQAAWLDADLGANRRPWTIAYLHRPPFSSGDHGGDARVRQHFVPLFARHGVPLVLAGHEHHYERTRVLDGVTYVVAGGGGRGTRPVGHSSFTAFAESVCHFVYVTVTGDELTLHAIDGIGQEFDSLVIRRPASAP